MKNIKLYCEEIYIIQCDEVKNYFHGTGSYTEKAEALWEDRFAENAEELGQTFEEIKEEFFSTFEEYSFDEFLKFCLECGVPENCSIIIKEG